MNKLAVITGGGTGIGRALALRLAARGSNVLVTGRRIAPLEEVASHSDGIDFIQGDVTDSAHRAEVAGRVGNRSVDYLVHNAGVFGDMKSAMEIEEGDFRNVMETNVMAPLFLTQALVTTMRPGSRVLNIGSGAAHFTLPGWLSYSTSKAAFNMLYQGFRQELGQQGIHCGSVMPGVIDTAMQSHIQGNDPEVWPIAAMMRQFKAQMSPDRRVGEQPPDRSLDTPENVAVFLEWLLCVVDGEEFAAEEWDIQKCNDREWWKAVVDA